MLSSLPQNIYKNSLMYTKTFIQSMITFIENMKQNAWGIFQNLILYGFWGKGAPKTLRNTPGEGVA